MTFLKGTLLASAIVLTLFPGRGRSAELSSLKWRFSELATGQPLGSEISDGNINTAWISRLPVKPGVGISIDLGQDVVVQRLFFTPGKAQGSTPRSLKVIVDSRSDGALGPATLTVNLPADKRDVDLFFDPVVTRHVRLEATAASDQPWAIAEMEIYGSADPAAFQSADAVVIDAAAPAPLRRAAEELRYYVGELTGKPLPLVSPDQSGQYPGTLYRIVDLKPLAMTREQMRANEESGKFPATSVNVVRDRREVIFRAWPYANVRASVWAFLEKQGVRWLYPDDHGDFVPTGKGVDLSCLPLRFTPSASRRYANFEMPQQAAKAAAATNDPAFLFWWRNGYNSTWGNAQQLALGGEEVPADPQGLVPSNKLPDEFREGFEGYPHNFDTVLPKRILDQHPDWWGSVGGRRVAPSQGGPTVCLSSPGLIQFIIDKAIAATEPESAVTLNLLPMDSASFCDCERCRRLYEPLFKSRVAHAEICPFEASDAYYYLISEVAKGIRQSRPKVRILALAYADVLEPPRKIDKLPDNVTVEICNLGAPALPMSSPVNEPMRTCDEQWHRKCATLEHYEYVLLNEGKTSKVMPVPLVSGMAERARFFRSLGAVNGGTQADPQSLRYSPWNHYAYPRLLRNPDLTARELLEEFFTGYFREAGQPLLAYYRALEDHLTSNDISLRPLPDDFTGTYTYDVQPGSFPYALLVEMRGHLQEAEKRATGWIVRERVARIREGFEWVVKESGFAPADLDDPAGFVSVPSDGTALTVDLSKIPLHKLFVEPQKQGGWLFEAHGMIGADVRLAASGAYVITVTAKGTPYENIDPVMNVYLDQHHAGSIAVTPVEYKEYTFHQTMPTAGVSRVLVSYWNGATGGRRNLYVKQIRIALERP